MTDIYPFSATTLDGQTIDLSAYRDQVVLIVNTASACGFTPQYRGLETLYPPLPGSGICGAGLSLQPIRQTGTRRQRHDSRFLPKPVPDQLSDV
jgi:glutathione peroxidase